MWIDSDYWTCIRWVRSLVPVQTSKMIPCKPQTVFVMHLFNLEYVNSIAEEIEVEFVKICHRCKLRTRKACERGENETICGQGKSIEQC